MIGLMTNLRLPTSLSGRSCSPMNVSLFSQIITESLFADADTSTVLPANDLNGVELGVRFSTSVDGKIVGLAYLKSATDNGPHRGSLWSVADGTLLGQLTFSDETASGWQTAVFDAPVVVAAGLYYVASYHSDGFYSATGGYFSADHVSGSLTAPSAGGNGLYSYTYGPNSLLPSSSFNSTNYWIDVLFQASS
ncbi:DUF4082 domain-containing protein [Rhizobium laguerreae]|uniref:DUF4082 domain-containing protein n=1 Tax=Rhizobium laguerreae TaxID=1076926 RepID=UPI001C906C27|nr:DUF4082 domain-containing protein [Rhizobium laguerreae]MBY3434806.1 DUF4082 domain-containing protein [Rhizobium laguerreae]MBY3448949.1 DUF4082 domain-containing protein [Rhizobium laguerreae]MBY3456723.1 DUF4082 domain-containing protein [Rhizobium laguerreae]